ncbi:tRNA (uridine(54)-C5)-methyltransferase TrmA [Marinobacterium sp. xm-d-564]|uniref:tRNA (uridine(54)-C5)-methyltransferase TrmA n=1 Tax=Marinobacterium sp. xm-d-564 TaxID=2497742 RepID=UPI001569C90B|nr:tRNA (uridine(54)-C5)-methyltransferase TrmA [Marinobacterium sp. xm-d-564]NRP59172.1 tRNA/tmRNA (uracil-C(5))-methyltransferase [Marinobacterium sp. xm-d-564]
MSSLPVIDPALYEQQLAEKAETMQQLFSGFDLPELELFRSPPENYRMRAEFRVWHDGDEINYVMFEPGDKRKPVKLSACKMVDTRIESMMFNFLDRLKGEVELRKRLFQIDFLATLKGELLVSMLYHRAIGEEWIEAAKPLREEFGIDIVGRSRKNKIVLDRDFVIETIQINGQPFTYKQTENSFTQPNAKVCEQMIEWALDATQDARGDLVEFYCGNGNFSLPLAQNFDRVVGTEISKESVRSAQYNIEVNGVENVSILRLSSEEFTEVLQGTRTSRRTEGLDLTSFDFQTVLVDPPRAGLDAETVKQVQTYPAIVYISCNPETLKENLEILSQTHDVQRFALFDQFPYTHHVECGVYLTKKV